MPQPIWLGHSLFRCHCSVPGDGSRHLHQVIWVRHDAQGAERSHRSAGLGNQLHSDAIFIGQGQMVFPFRVVDLVQRQGYCFRDFPRSQMLPVNVKLCCYLGCEHREHFRAVDGGKHRKDGSRRWPNGADSGAVLASVSIQMADLEHEMRCCLWFCHTDHVCGRREGIRGPAGWNSTDNPAHMEGTRLRPLKEAPMSIIDHKAASTQAPVQRRRGADRIPSGITTLYRTATNPTAEPLARFDALTEAMRTVHAMDRWSQDSQELAGPDGEQMASVYRQDQRCLSSIAGSLTGAGDLPPETWPDFVQWANASADYAKQCADEALVPVR